MRRSIALAVLIGASAAASGCNRQDSNPGPVVSRGYQVGAFDQVEAAGPFDVTIHTGAAPGVQARGNQSLIDRLAVEVQNGKLSIRTTRQHGWFNFGIHHANVRIDVTVPTLHGATLAGAGDLNIDRVQGDHFEGRIAGTGDLTIGSVDLGSLMIGVAGTGDATVRGGKAQSAQYEVAGVGDVDASAVTTQDLKASVAGTGDLKAHATGTAVVDVMGTGDVTVTGGAKCTVSKSGAGDVHCS
jgi:hypothetical protein